MLTPFPVCFKAFTDIAYISMSDGIGAAKSLEDVHINGFRILI